MTRTATTYSLSNDVETFLSGNGHLFIDGQFVPSQSGECFDSIDPATGRSLMSVSRADGQDIDRAVKAAQLALAGPWGSMPPMEREALLHRLADLVEAHQAEFAELEALDNGKPKSFAAGGDLPLALGHLRYFAGWPSKIAGQVAPTGYPGMHAYVRREPVGVVGAIIPWNFPLLMAAWKLAPALAAGCTVVLKPAEQTPLSALRLAELIGEAGFPAGVVNICPGFGEDAGRALVDHPGVDKIAFTGSVEVGREVAATAGRNLKHVSIELGGKSPNIVLPDADVEAAAAGAAQAIFYLSGQTCSAGSRLMVHESLYDDVVGAVVAQAEQLVMGPGMSDTTTLGPLVSEAQVERVLGYVREGEREGASVALGGRRANGNLSDGFFIEPTVLVDVPDDLTVCREEIFGPVVVVQRFADLDELITRANSTNFGLAAGVWTQDLHSAHELGARLQAGTVWVNCYNFFDASMPFGGFKNSGYGKDGGVASLDKYLQDKAVWVNHGA